MSETLDWTFNHFDDLNPHEIYEICAARQEVFVVGQNLRYIDCDGKDLTAWHLQGRNSHGLLLAYLRVLPPGDKHHYHSIGRVLTRPAWRGKGFGKQLMSQCLAYCAKQFGDVPLTMAAQRYLEAFYQGFQFQTQSEPFDEEGIEHVMMTRPTTVG